MNSPYSTKFASGEINYDNDPSQQMKQWKKEERDTHKAPNILPYELGEVPQYYANIIDNAMQAIKALDVALKSKEFKNKKQLLELKRNTEKMMVYLLKNVDPTLEVYSIGAKHIGDEPDEVYDN
jgi:hypothetical protein